MLVAITSIAYSHIEIKQNDQAAGRLHTGSCYLGLLFDVKKGYIILLAKTKRHFPPPASIF